MRYDLHRQQHRWLAAHWPTETWSTLTTTSITGGLLTHPLTSSVMAYSLPDIDRLTPLTKIVLKNATRMSLNERITPSRYQCYATFTAHWQRIDQPTDMIDTDNHSNDWPIQWHDLYCFVFMYLCSYVHCILHPQTRRTLTATPTWPTLAVTFAAHWQRIDQPTDTTYSGSDNHWPSHRHDLHWQQNRWLAVYSPIHWQDLHNKQTDRHTHIALVSLHHVLV